MSCGANTDRGVLTGLLGGRAGMSADLAQVSSSFGSELSVVNRDLECCDTAGSDFRENVQERS